MKKITNLLFLLAIFLLASCGEKKAEVLLAPEIDATIGVELGHYWNMSNVALSPDGNTCASSAYDGTIIIWNYKTKHQIKTFRRENSKSNANYISLKYTSDGKQLIAGSSMFFIDIFDIENSTKSQTIEIKGYNGKTLAVSKDDKYIAVAGKDNIISLIEIATGKIAKTFEGHTNSIYELAFSPDNKTLGSASYDKTARIWDIEKGKLIKKIEAKDEVNSITFNENSDKFAFSIKILKLIEIWDLSKMKKIKSLEEIAAEQLIFKAENLLIRQYSKITLNNIETGEEIKSIKNYDWSISVNQDIIATAGSDGVNIINFNEGTNIAQFGQDTRFVSQIKVSPSGKFIVTANSHKSGSGGPDILSYAVDTNYNFTAYGTSGGGVELFSFLGTEDVIFSEELLGEGYYYDLTSGNSKSKIQKKVTDPFTITKDGLLMIANNLNNKGSYAIFDAKTGELKTELINNSSHLYFAGLTPDDKYYVLLTMDFCKVFEIPSGKEVANYKREDMDNIVFVDITADGKYIVGRADTYGDFMINDILTGENIFLAKDVSPQNATLNIDKNTLAIASSDWTVKIFDIVQNAQTQTLTGHFASCKGIAYTPDGKYLLSSAQDNQTIVWSKAGEKLLTIVGLEKLSDYDGETQDFVIFSPSGRYDGTEAGINQFLYFEKDGKRFPASDYKDKCYTPNLLGRTLGQDFIEFNNTQAK